MMKHSDIQMTFALDCDNIETSQNQGRPTFHNKLQVLSFQVQKKIVCIGRIASVMLVLEGQSGMGNLPPTNLPHQTAQG